jgi:uncharacterized protein YggE
MEEIFQRKIREIAWRHRKTGCIMKMVDRKPRQIVIASGADIKSVQDLLGYAAASFTLNVYAHTSEQMMKDTAARMQSYYDNLAAKG